MGICGIQCVKRLFSGRIIYPWKYISAGRKLYSFLLLECLYQVNKEFLHFCTAALLMHTSILYQTCILESIMQVSIGNIRIAYRCISDFIFCCICRHADFIMLRAYLFMYMLPMLFPAACLLLSIVLPFCSFSSLVPFPGLYLKACKRIPSVSAYVSCILQHLISTP